MPDELLRPTIGTDVDLAVRPWRLMSQTYVAFFGGVVAATAIAFLNARRLGVDAARQRLILLTGAVGLVAATILFALPFGEWAETPLPNVADTAVALVCSFVQQRIQRPVDRAVQLRGTEYRSLWGPGIAATIGGAAVLFLIAFLMDGML
jgi:hypothetical protein